MKKAVMHKHIRKWRPRLLEQIGQIGWHGQLLVQEIGNGCFFGKKILNYGNRAY